MKIPKSTTRTLEPLSHEYKCSEASKDLLLTKKKCYTISPRYTQSIDRREKDNPKSKRQRIAVCLALNTALLSLAWFINVDPPPTTLPMTNTRVALRAVLFWSVWSGAISIISEKIIIDRMGKKIRQWHAAQAKRQSSNQSIKKRGYFSKSGLLGNRYMRSISDRNLTPANSLPLFYLSTVPLYLFTLPWPISFWTTVTLHHRLLCTAHQARPCQILWKTLLWTTFKPIPMTTLMTFTRSPIQTAWTPHNLPPLHIRNHAFSLTKLLSQKVICLE